MNSRGGPHGFKRWPPPRVWCGTLLSVALSSIQDPPDANTIVGYILVIPTPGMLCRRQSDYAINKSNSAGDMSTGDTEVQEYRGLGVQEYQMSGSSIIIMSSPRNSDNHEYAM